MGATSSQQQVQAQIVSIANQYGVDPNLALAVAKQESGYQQYGASGGTLTSRAGALGVMQLMPATAAGLGVDPNDQTGNITGGVKLLSQLLSQFNGNVPNALAAYNAGPDAVQKYGGVPPYAETQNYVTSIMANYQPGSYLASAPSSSSGSVDTLTTGLPLSDPSATTSFDFSSLLPSPDASYDIGGITLTGSQLLLLGAGIVGVVVVSSIL